MKKSRFQDFLMCHAELVIYYVEINIESSFKQNTLHGPHSRLSFCFVDDILTSIVLMVSVINKFRYIEGGLK